MEAIERDAGGPQVPAPAAPTRVVVASPYSEAQRARLEALFRPAETVFLSPRDRTGLRRHLLEAEIVVLKGTPDESFLEHDRLRWVHCNQSGLDRCASQQIVTAPFHVTSASGRSAPVLAEHALFFMLSLAYDSHALLTAQRRRAWGLRNAAQLRGLVGRKVLVVGLGHTARALVPRCQALGMQVRAFRRRALGDGGLGIPAYSRAAGDAFETLLVEADVLVLAASLNDSSHHMLGVRQFEALKPGAMLVYVARGRLVDTRAMKAALDEGRLAAAGLDVTHPEPLPPWDSLWRRRNVLLTPHVTPQVADREHAEVDIIAHNYGRYLAGAPLENLLHPEDLYTRGARRPVHPLLRRALRLRAGLLSPSVQRR
ncbi:NAD(P)-dependent oxidoreductase [Pseudohaliea sp.]|uniref:NAD(P)-dependent oxidoreductase n=1 Tax=Pseudohaliea sp. TaxID=2740289 RepID=UPI0032F09210